MYIFIISYL